MTTAVDQLVQQFHENGYVRLEGVFTGDELAELTEEINQVIHHYADWEAAWRGEWRKEYVEEDLLQRIRLVAINDFHPMCGAWMRAIVKKSLVETLAQLMGTDLLEFHHSTLHAKPPNEGAPFPLHQDLPFYPHEDGLRYLDVLVHLDDADEENGCLRFLPGSHRWGPLDHIVGPDTAPHLPTDRYRLSDTVPVSAKAGDVIVFTLWTVHGSSVNKSDRWRRIVRLGYRDPRNRQTGGHGFGQRGLMVLGVRPKD
ncbi:MAG: phytanoyl-CoA dioxygenase family protein [Armatimonadetes bacterium]|nr:phytanoyl-CoA dioxygenase family protein [Armatimonadota bacterium]MDW8121789.1 phytanoyl-CoA dioxygenase family protein [Armatimonadota bacterium]